MSDRFYRAFEERYYAPREVIKALRRQYLPFAQPLAELYPGAATFDAGCGRGEWLELMGELELSPSGVDLDEGMLAACVERGLPAQKGDAVDYIATLPSDSQIIVSAFHVVEHITFEQLRTLVAEALRVLKPGGLLIMETPNPENIVVATRNFYLDPTHQRPIPSMLLAFVAEFAGFSRVKTLRLQESKSLVNRGEVSLQDVFAGVSPDYAVVAQKHASEDVLALTAQPFSLDYGLSLENLLSRWDSRFNRLETKAQQAETASQHWQQQAHQWHEYILALHASTSWKITKPLRAIKRLLSGDFAAIRSLTTTTKLKAKQTFRSVVSASIGFVFKRPGLRKPLSSTLKFFPKVHRRLLHVGVNTGVVKMGGMYVSNSTRPVLPPELDTMTPRARLIYQKLKAAIEDKNKRSA